jgi:hypothetical protein
MSNTTASAMPSPDVLRQMIDKLPAGWLGDLGERLRGDANGELRTQYLAGFDAAIDKARTRLARPLPDADYAATQATIDACVVAREVLIAVSSAFLSTPGALRSGP